MNSNAFSDRLVTPMDTASHPAQRGTERYRRRVKRVGRRTLGRGVTGEEERRRGGGAGDYKRRKIYNPRMKFIRTSHLPLSTLRKLQRASSYSFLSFSLSLFYLRVSRSSSHRYNPSSFFLSLSYSARYSLTTGKDEGPMVRTRDILHRS